MWGWFSNQLQSQNVCRTADARREGSWTDDERSKVHENPGVTSQSNWLLCWKFSKFSWPNLCALSVIQPSIAVTGRQEHWLCQCGNHRFGLRTWFHCWRDRSILPIQLIIYKWDMVDFSFSNLYEDHEVREYWIQQYCGHWATPTTPILDNARTVSFNLSRDVPKYIIMDWL